MLTTTSDTPAASAAALYLVVADGRRQRFYLTYFTAQDGLPRFKAGAAGRASAVRFLSRADAEAAAQRAQAGDAHGLTWRAILR
jgi:hypothetical protein